MSCPRVLPEGLTPDFCDALTVVMLYPAMYYG